MKNALDLATLVYSKDPKSLTGSGMAKVAADDLQLRPLWIQAQEQMAMGEIPTVDYETWKKQKVKEMSNKTKR